MALKAMWKSHIVASQLTAHVHRERDTMLEVAMATAAASAAASASATNDNSSADAPAAPPTTPPKPSPWLVTLHASFADDRRVYLLMDACPGGELFSYLRTRPRSAGPLSERDARFYVAGVALALRELHSRSLVYRDLKPENVLLTSRGYPRLADFGFVKRVPAGGRTHTLCGTPEYLAPEVVERRGHWQAADWWALGVLAYELACGAPPFYARDPVSMYAQIREAKPRFPKSMSEELRDFCARLLHRTPALRLGAGEKGAQEVLEHGWFSGFDWLGFERGEIAAPYVPPAIVVAVGKVAGGGKAEQKLTPAALAAAAQAEAEMAASGLGGAQYRDAPYESQGDFADF
jgi:serine/threonine protein kinase